ncbi:MAG: PDGLE domain-containing protein [Candidatus Omnitrophota bacterium]
MKKKEVIVVLLFSLVIAAALSLLASNFPDGLQRVAIDKQFINREAEPLWRAPFADYQIAAVRLRGFSSSLAGLLGTLLVFALTYFLARGLKGGR